MTLPHPRDLVGLSRLNQAPPKKNKTQTAFVHAFRGGVKMLVLLLASLPQQGDLRKTDEPRNSVLEIQRPCQSPVRLAHIESAEAQGGCCPR